MNNRTDQLQSWVSKQLGRDAQLNAIQGDASFRHYYRVPYGDITYIAVDAPPQQEDSEAFVALSLMLSRQSICVPEIISYDYTQGFMLLTDLGDTLLLDVLNDSNAENWYTHVFILLRQLQLCPLSSGYEIPPFDKAHILKELGYFDEWCLDKLLGLKLSKAEQNVLTQLYAQLCHSFENQPQVLTHRDFHSRNIMILANGDLGLIDYQDAMVAPVTYDLASLLKDCYIRFEEPKIKAWVKMYYQLLSDEKMVPSSFESFYRGFDEVGLQRHLKVLGIFSRLKLRDHKQGYLKDTPRIMAYIKEVVPRYGEFAAFESLLYEKIIPSFQKVWDQEGISQVA